MKTFNYATDMTHHSSLGPDSVIWARYQQNETIANLRQQALDNEFEEDSAEWVKLLDSVVLERSFVESFEDEAVKCAMDHGCISAVFSNASGGGRYLEIIDQHGNKWGGTYIEKENYSRKDVYVFVDYAMTDD